jgi:hypothetical protein
MRALLLATVVLGLAACSEEAAKTYPSYQQCFDDKVDRMMKMKTDAIVECCIDHKLGDKEPPHCGNDESECINYLTGNLDSIDAEITVQMQGCAAYIAAKAQM